MRCPHTTYVVNPTFLKLYPEFAKEYVNQSGGLSLKCVMPASQLVDVVYKMNLNTDVPPVLEVPCGKCMVCKANKQQDWIFRLKQELDNNLTGYFVTLTYNDAYLPCIDSDGFVHRLADMSDIPGDSWPTVVKSDFQKFMKRLRKSSLPFKLRYLAVGEYGGRTHRPHYHILLFGLPPYSSQFDPLNHISKSWSFGQIDVGDVTPKSINYVTSYIVNSKAAPFPHSEPVFSLMSRRPGLGACFLDSKERKNRYTEDALLKNEAFVAHDGHKMPMPRYYKLKYFNEEARIQKQINDFQNEKTLNFEYTSNIKNEKRKKALVAEPLLEKRANQRKNHSF